MYVMYIHVYYTKHTYIYVRTYVHRIFVCVLCILIAPYFSGWVRYQVLVVVLTFLCYMTFHLTRKTISSVKVRVCGHVWSHNLHTYVCTCMCVIHVNTHANTCVCVTSFNISFFLHFTCLQSFLDPKTCQTSIFNLTNASSSVSILKDSHLGEDMSVVNWTVACPPGWPPFGELEQSTYVHVRTYVCMYKHT